MLSCTWSKLYRWHIQYHHICMPLHSTWSHQSFHNSVSPPSHSCLPRNRLGTGTDNFQSFRKAIHCSGTLLRSFLPCKTSPVRNSSLGSQCCTCTHSRRQQACPLAFHFDTLGRWLLSYMALSSHNLFPHTRSCTHTCSRLPQSFLPQWRRSGTLGHLTPLYMASRSRNWFPRIRSCTHTCSRLPRSFQSQWHRLGTAHHLRRHCMA